MFPETVFFGLLPMLKRLQELPVGSNSFHAAVLCAGHFGSKDIFNKEGWSLLRKDYPNGLPLSIKAVPEGTVVPTHNVLMTIENTDERFPWLTNWVETQLMQIWYPITVATLSREIKKMILKYLDLTGDPAGIDFKLHDFGFRGVSSVESAMIGGAAHLVNFHGTDTLIALQFIAEHYGFPVSEKLAAGYSIPAAEHSTITSWGRENELAAYRNMLDQFPTGLVAVVSDSYDIYHACEKLWGEDLREQVLQRSGTVVIRPDSGYPPEVVCKVLASLGKKFGFTKNAKGFHVLPPQVRVIQGDGVDYDMIRNVLHAMYELKWSADNIAFGMGGALLQKLNRDTQKMAIKCSAIKRDGIWEEVSKDPITDKGKKSKAGRLKLIETTDEFGLYPTGIMTVRDEPRSGSKDLLREVYRDGKILDYPSFDQIRARAK